jgi:hypothetical protein
MGRRGHRSAPLAREDMNSPNIAISFHVQGKAKEKLGDRIQRGPGD